MTWEHTGSGLANVGSEGGLPIKGGDSGSVDAFARLRISEPFTLFDSKQIWDDGDIANSAENYPLFWDNQETSGSGTTTTFNVNRASTTLGVANATAGTRVRQTKQRFNYQPGKSLLIILTGLIGNTSAGNTKRYGYYDGNDGVFYQDSEGTLGFVIRSSVSGSPVDTVINQADWNLDKLDGTGPSGIVLKVDAVQILFFDLEWLGVGRVRLGFFVKGMPIYCHEQLHSNISPSVYMSTPNLPVRSEISNDGGGGADTIEVICTTVISEGGVQPNGITRFADIGTESADDIAGTSPGNAYAICGIRLKSAYLSATVRETFISLIENSGANNPFLWKLHFNPTITAALTYADVANSAIQFGIGDTSTAGNNVITNEGIVVGGGYQARQDANANVPLENALRLGALIDGTRDELVLSGSPLSNTQLYFAGMKWLEAW